MAQELKATPFEVKDCALIARMGGVSSAVNLRELKERVLACPVESLFHHFCETLIRPTFDDPEFRNDFSVWASRDLRDRVLAERLGVLNPYVYEDLEELRQKVVDIIDERLSEVPTVPWVKRGDDFRFMRAVTVVFSADAKLDTPRALVNYLPEMTHSSIYYHFIEARRRHPEGIDDFTAWLQSRPEPPERLIATFGEIDFYFMSLSELHATLISVCSQAMAYG